MQMESVDEIELSAVMQTDITEEVPVTPDNPELNSTNNLPTISTDNLPITPLRNKRWLSNASESQNAGISLNLTPTSISPIKSQDNEKPLYIESPPSRSYNLTLPNTDNLLDINVPKTTLLGKHQAKKRLHAFSLNKQNSLNASPLNKKKNVREPKYLLQENEDKYNENGEKTDAKFVLIKRPARKTANPTDKAKAVVEEIEEIKKIESAYLEALEQGLLEPRNRRSRSTSRSRERNKRRSSRKEHRRSRSVEVKPRKSVEKPKYPTNWTEMNHKGYTFETVLNMKPKEFKTKDNEPFDFRKMLLFQTPSLPVCRLTVKTVNGKERIIPPECIRFTNKSPRISYSTKENMPNDYFSRKCVLQYVPKSYQHGMKRMINNTMVISNSEVPIKVTNRKWFPKTILNKSDDSTECKIIENSLGLSFLQNYSDGDEQEKEVNEEKEEKIKETKVEEVETKVQVLYSEEEMEEKVVKCEKVKKHKKKEKKKHKSKPKKEKRKKKKKKSKIIKENKHEKVKKRKNSTADEDKKKQPEKVDDGHKNKQDESNKSSKRTRCHSNDTKTKARSSSKEEKSSKPSKSKKRTSSEGTDKSVKEEPRKDPKPESSTKQHPKKNKPEEIVEKREKHAAKHKSRSTSREKKPKSTEKPSKIKSPKPESETKKIKCVAEKEFGTPDTDEYYSNWESDVELSNSEKSRRNESTSINQSWQSDEDQLEISDDIPLVKSPFQIIKSPQQNKEEVKRTYKRDKSVEEKRRPSLRDRSPLRPRHLDTFPIELSPIQNELQSSPPENDFSPFRNRIEDRRRSRRSMERSPEKFLEMPLNIRNTRYSRKPWEEERFEDKYNRSPEHVENKVYALFSENAWERDDYLTIQSEEIKLEEERRTLIEERRKLEIERRKFQELERQRYYNRMTEFDEKRCGFEERRQEEFKMSDDEDKRYRSHRDYRETREPHPQYSQEIDVPSRRSCEDQRSRRRYSPEPPRERTRDDFNWEDTTDNSKRVEKYVEKPQDQDSTKKRRKSRWQNLDDLEPIHEATYTKTEGNKSDSVAPNKPEQKSYSKEKKISKRDRWESSEDETIIRDDKKSVDKPSNKQEQHKKLKDVNKSKEKRDREKPKRTSKKEEENKQKSLTDNLDLPPHKPISRTPSIKKPEILENEYEKFMQALGSEISTAEEISDKDFEQKRKSTEKRNKKHKSYSRSVSISSDEEFEKHTTKEMRKRKVKKRISSSSSSSTSSTTSGTDSSTDSSSLSSSSDFSSDEEKTKKLKKRKVEGVKVKMEDIESEETEQTDTNLGNFDVITVNRIKGKEIAEVIKIEDPDDKLNTNAKSVTTPHKMIGANLNIINLTIPEFTTSPEKALPSHEALKALVKPFEAPQPVPSPKLSLIIPINEPVLPKIEPLVPKMEPPVHTFPKTEPETAKTIPTLPAIVPVPPVIQFSTNLSSFESEINDLNTGPDISAIKEEPTTPEENKFEENPALIDVLNTPTKRSNIIPIKFLTAELRKQASESSPHIISLGNIESKEIIPTNPVLIDVKTSMDNKIEVIESLPLTNRKRHFALSCINVPAKRPLLEGSDNEENSTDFTDKFKRQDDTLDEVSTSSAQFIEIIEMRNQAPLRQSPKMRERSFERDRTSNEPSKERKKQRSISPRRKREFSPRRRDSRSPRRQDLSKRWSRDVSPRRRERDLSPRGPRMSSPGRWDRNGSPRRSSRDRSTRRSRDDLHRRHSTSPGQRDGRRDYRSISPGLKKRLSPRHRSPSRRSMSREFSPRRHRSKDRSSSKDHKLESIQETLQRIAGVDKYRIKHSPISSPLHGFKRSVADSTISDDQLLQHNSEEYTASPSYSNTTEFFKNSVTHTSSPKRMSLDERISQALGLAADQQPKPISTTYSANYECDAQYFDQYGQYYEQYDEQNKKSETFSQSNKSYRATRQRENSNLKVVQVGNVLQVVPIEDAPPKPKPPPVQQNKVTNSTQKIVQVGNMLQIVPTATLPDIPVEVPIVPPLPPLPVSPTPSPPTPLATTIKDPLNAETLIKQKAERRAEKDNRRQEREKKRKEKEKKRKEREKRKQFKAKMQTEAMIKQALIKETEETPVGNEENLNLEGPIECQQAPVQWPPVPQIVCNNLYKPAGKGILSQGSRGNLNEEGEYKRKTVKFSDGVMPGEGTSPSGGEELSSPPPAPKKLPKEKRFIKTKVPKKVKVPKKKKVKVKVIRQQQTQGIDDDEDEDDNLPPPPPPPGSPPPHLFPARIKQPVINNIHPNVVVSIANQPLQLTNTSYPPPSVYRPTQPPVIMPHHHGHHHGPPHLPLHGHGHHHHPPPCPPPHHVGFNPPTVVVPPVISVVPSIPAVVAPCYPPQHSHHHHHGGPHHHHSPHHHGHHHH